MSGCQVNLLAVLTFHFVLAGFLRDSKRLGGFLMGSFGGTGWTLCGPLMQILPGAQILEEAVALHSELLQGHVMGSYIQGWSIGSYYKDPEIIFRSILGFFSGNFHGVRYLSTARVLGTIFRIDLATCKSLQLYQSLQSLNIYDFLNYLFLKLRSES